MTGLAPNDKGEGRNYRLWASRKYKAEPKLHFNVVAAFLSGNFVIFVYARICRRTNRATEREREREKEREKQKISFGLLMQIRCSCCLLACFRIAAESQRGSDLRRYIKLPRKSFRSSNRKAFEPLNGNLRLRDLNCDQ
jgi:hypothetical protein